MRKLNRAGFSGVETVLVVIIIALIGFVGYYVYHSNQVASKTYSAASNEAQANPAKAATNGTAKLISACTVNASTKGGLYKAAGNAYSICIPDGWSLSLIKSAGGESLWAGLPGIKYVAGTSPKVTTETGGKDGIFDFTVYYNAKNADLSSYKQYKTVKSIAAKNVSGTEYFTSDKSVLGLNADDVNLNVRAFVFVKDQKSVVVEYSYTTGETDQYSLFADIAKTLSIN